MGTSITAAYRPQCNAERGLWFVDVAIDPWAYVAGRRPGDRSQEVFRPFLHLAVACYDRDQQPEPLGPVPTLAGSVPCFRGPCGATRRDIMVHPSLHEGRGQMISSFASLPLLFGVMVVVGVALLVVVLVRLWRGGLASTGSDGRSSESDAPQEES